MHSGLARQGSLLGGVFVACGAVALLAAGCSEANQRSDAGSAAGNAAAAASNSGTSGRVGLSVGGSSSDAGTDAEVEASPSTDAGGDPSSGGSATGGASAGAPRKGHWVALGAPQAPPIGAFALADDGTLFAGVESLNAGITGGLFSTSDGGNAWGYTSNGLSGSGVTSLAVASSGVFATIGTVLFRSQDHGASWHRTSATGRRVAARGNLVVLADPYYAVSTDGGQTFTKESAQVGATSDDVVIVGKVILRATNGLLSRSPDQGATFAPVQPPAVAALRNVSLECDRSTTCFWAASDNTAVSLYRSTDSGATWVSLGREITRVLAVTDEGSVYVRNDAQIIERSDDGGATWVTCADPAAKGSCDLSLFSAGGDRAFASCTSGVYRSDDRGLHWLLANGSQATGALTDAAAMLFVDRSDAARAPSGDIYVGAPAMRRSKLFSSADDGQSWSTGSALSSNACVSSENHTIICTDGSVSRSEDHGATWAYGKVDLDRCGTSLAAGSSGIYLAGDGKQGCLCRSDDDGRTFTVISAIPYTAAIQLLKSGRLIRRGSKFEKSLDRGETWSDIAWPARALPVPEDAEGRLYAGVLGKLMVSSDAGDSWTELTETPAHSSLVPNSLLERDSKGRFYLSPTTGVAPAIFVSDLGSSTWETLPRPPSPSIFKLDFDKQDRLLAATSAGLYRFESE